MDNIRLRMNKQTISVKDDINKQLTEYKSANSIRLQKTYIRIKLKSVIAEHIGINAKLLLQRLGHDYEYTTETLNEFRCIDGLEKLYVFNNILLDATNAQESIPDKIKIIMSTLFIGRTFEIANAYKEHNYLLVFDEISDLIKVYEQLRLKQDTDIDMYKSLCESVNIIYRIILNILDLKETTSFKDLFTEVRPEPLQFKFMRYLNKFTSEFRIKETSKNVLMMNICSFQNFVIGEMIQPARNLYSSPTYCSIITLSEVYLNLMDKNKHEMVAGRVLILYELIHFVEALENIKHSMKIAISRMHMNVKLQLIQIIDENEELSSIYDEVLVSRDVPSSSPQLHEFKVDFYYQILSKFCTIVIANNSIYRNITDRISNPVQQFIDAFINLSDIIQNMNDRFNTLSNYAKLKININIYKLLTEYTYAMEKTYLNDNS